MSFKNWLQQVIDKEVKVPQDSNYGIEALAKDSLGDTTWVGKGYPSLIIHLYEKGVEAYVLKAAIQANITYQEYMTLSYFRSKHPTEIVEDFFDYMPQIREIVYTEHSTE